MTIEQTKPWYQRIGPAMITLCVVIGPGSIMASTKVGAQYGYSMIWLLAIAVIFMLTYLTLGVKIGVMTGESLGTVLANRIGRWLSVSIGMAMFFATAVFQFANNIALHTAVEPLLKDFPESTAYVAVFLFNLLMVGFLFLFRNLYKALERLMMFFVALILIAFIVNLVVIKPDVTKIAGGLIPTIPLKFDTILTSLIATTFIAAAAYYQAYLVKQKGWTKKDLKTGLTDARIGAILVAVITLIIMVTSATILQGKKVENLTQVADQLAPLFGDFGPFFFSLGLFSAAYSSFLVNSMIGGFLLSDGLGISSSPEHPVPKTFSAAVLIIGMCIAFYAISQDVKPVSAIVAAQALTLIVAPLMAGVMLWLSNQKDIMGEHKNKLPINVIATLGFITLLFLSANKLYNLIY